MIEGWGSGSGSGGAGGSSGGGSVENARHADSAYDVDINSPAYLRWLRKDVADTAAEVITFAKGIISTLKSYFNGGIEVTNGTKTDVLNVTGGANVGGSLGVTGNATIGGNASVTGSVTAAQLIANLLKTPDFQQIVGMIGLGFGVTTDVNGKATLQTDDLYVLGQMFVNSLNIREVTYIGGTYLLTPAGSTVAKVMPLYAASGYSSYNTRYWTTTPPYASATVVGYRLMWKADDGTTGTMNYWQQGDQAFCQTFNITAPGQYTNARNSRYWRMVCRVGQVTVDDVVWHYADVANTASVYLYDSNGNAITNVRTGNTIFPGYENSSGTVPSVDDKVVCLGSQAQTNRQGAIQLTAEGTASIGIYDNINNFLALTNYEIHYFSKEAVRMTASYLTWKTSSGNETQATFMADTKQAFVGIGNCGIDFANGLINLRGNKVTFGNTAGTVTGKVYIDPTTGTLHAVDGDFSGTVTSVHGSFTNLYCEKDDDIIQIGSNNYFNGLWGTVDNTLSFQYGGRTIEESGGVMYGAGYAKLLKINKSTYVATMSTDFDSESIKLNYHGSQGETHNIVLISKNSANNGQIRLFNTSGYTRLTLDGTNGDINAPNGTITAADIKSPKVESGSSDTPVALPDNLITGSGSKSLPTNPINGMTVLIKGTTGDITVYGSGKDIMASDSASTVTSLAIGRGSHIFTYDGTRWIHFDCS